LNQCGDPNSGFFDPLLNEIPTILNTLTGASTPNATTEQSLLEKGLQQIASAEQASGSSGASSAAPAPATQAPATPAPTTTTTAPPTTTTTTPSCGLLGVILGCGSNGTNNSNSSSGSSKGTLGGLLSNDVTQSQRATTSLAVSSTPTPETDPSLTAPAASLLPPLPQVQPHHRTHQAHRGLVSQWWHDVESWF
jgi:hypothetical protein